MQTSRMFLIFFTAAFGVMGGCSLFRNKETKHTLDISLDKAIQLENVVPVAIIGSGPAGLTAAMYIARAGMKPFVFAGPLPCGQLTETTIVENWPGSPKILGMNLMHNIKEQAESFGACIIPDTITKVDFSVWPFVMQTEDGKSFKAMSVIVATGAKPQVLHIPGEREYWGKGVTTCAVCDAYFFKDKEVVVIGGGDSAAEQVFELAVYARKVTVLVRKDKMRAAQSVQDRLAAYSNVSIEYNKEVTEIHGKDEQVHAIDVYDNVTKEKTQRPIDGVFLAIGHLPNTQMFKKFLDMDEAGYLHMHDRTQETSLPGIFACGEVQDSSYRQAIVAAGEGARAALDATSFLYDLGFTPDISKKLDANFFERFTDEPVEFEEIVEIAEFKERVLKGKGLVLVDFYSDTCPGCIKLIPSLEAVAHKFADRVKIYAENIARVRPIRKMLEAEYNLFVKHVPCILVFKDGKFVQKITDVLNKKQLIAEVFKHLD